MKIIEWINGVTKLNKATMDEFQNNIKEEFDSVNNKISSGIPIGSVIEYYLPNLPSSGEYLWCDGSEISRTEYSDLFEAMGIIYGEGDGETTFNLPDHREAVGVGYKEGSANGTSGATLGTLGARGGEFKHTMALSELVAHSHSGVVKSVSPSKQNTWDTTKTSSSVTNISTTTGNTNNAGSSTPFNIMQTYIVCNYIIKVK